LNEHEAKTHAIKARLNDTHQQLKREFDSLGTTHASSIATITGDKTYNRTKLNAEIDRIKAIPDTFILTEEALQAKVSLLRSTQDWNDINQVARLAIDLEALCQDLSTLIQKTASNEAITKLKENRELESWIRTGLTYHTDSTQCEFCGSTISADRLAALQRHFSKAYEDLTSEVAAQLTRIEETEFTITLPDERDFIPDLKEQFAALKAKFTEWVTWADTVIAELTTLAKKKQLSLESQLDCAVDTSRASEIEKIVVDFNALVRTHNEKRTQIDIEK